MAQTQVKQIIQKMVKILGYWEKEDENTPYKVRVEDCNDATVARLVYAFDIDPNKVTPGDIYLVNVAKVTKGNFGTEYKLAMKDNKPELMEFVEPAKIEKKVEEISISDDEISAAAIQSEKSAANKKRSAKTPILPAAKISTDTQIVKPNGTSSVPRELASIESAKSQFKLYQFVIDNIVTEEDYATVQGKKFLRKTGFKKLSLAFKLSDPVVQITWNSQTEVMVFATANSPDGRESADYAICSMDDVKGVPKTKHNMLTKGITRAKNRVISNLIGCGLVSFEEVT